METKFVQIAGTGSQLYALDDTGRVWQFLEVLSKWRLLTLERERQG